MQLVAHNCTVSVDMMNIDLTAFRVYVNEYFHHAVRFGLARVLVLSLLSCLTLDYIKGF